MAISVHDVPRIMRQHGVTQANAEWEKAAKLQDRWFAGAAYTAQPVAPNRFDFTHVGWPEESGITLDWILRADVDQDSRAKTPYGILQGAVVANEGAELAELKARVDELFNATAANTVELGALRVPAPDKLQAFHAQRSAFSSVETDKLNTPIDPLLGTLGSFNFYAIPAGRAIKRADGGVKVDIDAVLVYALDSFDFNGDQWLGFFAEPDRIAKDPFDGGSLLNNTDYRAWRTANQKGQDFLVMSDVRTLPLRFSFDYTPAPTLNGTWRSTDPASRFLLAINGDEAEWTETGPDTGLVYRNNFPVVQRGTNWHILRPNDDPAVLTMLGFKGNELQQAILESTPNQSSLVLTTQGPELSAKWSGIRVQKTPEGKFKKLIQPDDPAYPPSAYTLRRV